jgi:regulator of protease activity HflC (stomatin/prohibitin superfamily)
MGLLSLAMSQSRFPINGAALLERSRRFVFFAVVALAALFASCQCTTRIDAGHVGIRVKLAGSDRGVQDMQVKMGWVAYNPVTEQVITFPTSVQNIIWTASPHEGSKNDDSISFSSSEGVNISADVGLSFHIDPVLAPRLYGRFRQTDMKELANGYMRNVIRETFNEVGSRMPVQQIYGAGKSKMVSDVSDKVKEILGKDGIVIDQLTTNGALRLPENVANAINRAMEATQNAIQSENRVRQVKAEAEQAITQATGQAEALRQRAQGEADAILIRSKAEARANEIIRLSTSGSVLQYRALEKWDGKMPTFQGQGQMPLLTFDATKLAGNEAEREKKLKELLGEERSQSANRVEAPKPAEAPKVEAPKPAAAPAPNDIK